MKLKITSLALLIFITFASDSQTKSENLFYMVNTPESFESFKMNVSQISIVCPQTFQVSKEGVLTGSVDPRIMSIAKANKVKVIPLIVNPGFISQLLHDIVSNPIARKRSIEMMLEYAKRYSLDGWQFDMEGLNISDRDNFTLYFKETAAALHKAGLQLSAALVHATEDVGGPSAYHRFLYENWRAGYDFKELAETGDFISIMAYDQHTRRTTPGPVAGTKWVTQVVEYLLSKGVPPGKLSLGIPSYSVHWFTDYSEERGGFSNGKQIRYNALQYLLGQNNATPIWNENAGCNYAVWENGGTFEYVFIEDGRSLKQKLDILQKYKLRGISVWVAGSEGPDFWTVLQQEVSRK
ncbi:MAG: glycosyl hydrolase family 18 protein [Ginsengibacter sp.]